MANTQFFKQITWLTKLKMFFQLIDEKVTTFLLLLRSHIFPSKILFEHVQIPPTTELATFWKTNALEILILIIQSKNIPSKTNNVL